MKITVKTLQQKQFQIDAEGTDTVADLKLKINASQGHSIESQKIIYSGKVLSDDKTVESCQIKEKDFLVLMVSKPKPSPVGAAAGSSTAAAAPVAAPAQPAAPAPAPAVVAPAPAAAPAAAAPAPATGGAAPAFGDTSSFLSGEALNTSIQNMLEMGFSREEIDRAMRASYNNPDRAVEYLMTGIPAHLARPDPAPAQPAPAAGAAAPHGATAAAAQPAPAAPAQPAAPAAPQNLFQMAQRQQQQGRGGAAAGGLGVGLGAGAGAGAGGAAAAEGDLDRLRGTEGMQGIRQLVQQNPALLQSLIQQFAQQDPQLAQAVTQNPDLLLQMLAEGVGGDDEGDGPGGSGLPPNTQIINVTAEERDAIERLQALGFTSEQAIEAYFACGKDEELAANYLFEGGFED